MNKKFGIWTLGFGSLLVGAVQAAEPVFMSSDWAVEACHAWNREPVLTDKLVESGWIKNDKERGFKAVHIYRSDCPDSSKIEMRLALKDGKAQCVYGGAVETTTLDSGADYTMWAETKRWQEMGAGEYGPMKAMTFGRLMFKGPMWEALKNMGPFSEFLLLQGKVPGDRTTCPAAASPSAPPAS